MRQIVICETPGDVADAAADLVLESQREAVEARGVFRIALSGGHAIRAVCETLASEDWRKESSWESWEVFWADERAVPPYHADSNYALATAALLEHVPIPEVWRMRGEADSLEAAAEEYARTLKTRFGPGTPAFDTILLEMGDDGHVAALFPGSSALESGLLVEAVTAHHALPQRLTFTLRLLNGARQVIIMMTGEEKAEAVRDALVHNDVRFPAARIEPHEGSCWWLLDSAAASRIR